MLKDRASPEPNIRSGKRSMTEPRPTPTRTRAGRRGARPQTGGEAAPKAQPRLLYKPIEAVSADELEAFHVASLRVLEEIGIDFLHEGARDIVKQAGAEVTPGSNRVRFDRGLVESQIGKAPER